MRALSAAIFVYGVLHVQVQSFIALLKTYNHPYSLNNHLRDHPKTPAEFQPDQLLKHRTYPAINISDRALKF
ncbi:hypothetical protein Q7C36_016879 [Tachysurus vachellii]|uniref:Uncharacterized protein n=1 Tax=Tachysurus vachellii TaxID=175792 RepID=A0AA88SFG5_TACVA|nr:hypothetical protein Q7C36_016879 [Tachysurus vachellii]